MIFSLMSAQNYFRFLTLFLSRKMDQDFMPYWKNEEECYEEAKIEGKDSITGKKVSTHWPRENQLNRRNMNYG